MPIPAMIREHVPLAPRTTLGIGGPARFFIEATAESELIDVLDFARREGIPHFILGGGSNLLVADAGFPGLVVQVAMKGIHLTSDGDEVSVRAGAGEDWGPFVESCVELGLAGLECLSGIPGSVGGTPVQNVGAYGQEVSETISRVRAWDLVAASFVELSPEQCHFTYRRSIFNTTSRGRYVVLAVEYTLRRGGEPRIVYADLREYFKGRGSRPTLGELRRAVLEVRRRKGMVIDPQDSDTRSAGSFFKNPVISGPQLERLRSAIEDEVPHYPQADGMVKVPAAWLIEQAGFQRGYRRGGVAISNKHTLALVNRGGATAGEMLDLCREIRDRVEARFLITLQPEPVFVGFGGVAEQTEIPD